MIRLRNYRSQTALKHIAISLLFLGALLGLRTFWHALHATPEPLLAVGGVLDLTGRDLERSRPISLDGEWEFYPGAFVPSGAASASPRLLHVPGDWSSGWPEEKHSSLGYGTYRLRILIDRPMEQPYTFWVQKIEASSALVINGRTEASFGRLAETEEGYSPRMVSYTASYPAADVREIELLVRSANFDNPKSGGMIRSIKFGSQAAIDSMRWYSIGFQLVTFVVLLLHGLYAGILYAFKPQDKTLLIFCLLLLAGSLTVVTDHDNLLMLWLPLNYTWTLKVRILAYMWFSFLVLLLFRKFAYKEAGSPLFTAYTAAFVLYTAFVLAVPVTIVHVSAHFKVFTFFYLFPLVWFFLLIVGLIVRNHRDAVFLLFAAASLATNVIWGVILYKEGGENVYYPLDILAAIVSFSAYWFKRYFRNAEENAKLNEQLRASDRLKDQFLANTSHELRTPLHGIMNIAEMVAFKEKEAMNAKSFKDMELLITISRRMSHMLDDLLDVAKLQEKRITLHKEPLRIQSVAAGVLDMLAYMTEGKAVRLKLDIAESMPAVWADEKRLVQILFNLLHNALKYTEAGTIAISAEARGGNAVIQVSDTGAGMDERTRARIFLPYEQGLNTGGGIGLGLSICKQLVELHGGELEAFSEPGKGSVFQFVLPLANDVPVRHLSERLRDTDRSLDDRDPWIAADAPEEAWSVVQTAAPAFAGKPMNILAVDDDPVNLKVLASILSAEPYNVRLAGSAFEALDLLGSVQWDLLVVDVMMPGMSGYELTRKVRERFSLSELPVLLLTARSQQADIYTGFLAGANDYVTKPVDSMELKYRIWSLTTLKQSVHERLRMEAAYLQAQIHPHFLFNTLNSIMALSDIDSEKMRKLGSAFSSYLRISFDFLNTGELVELSHELELVRAYLYIEKERFEDRLSVQWDLDPDIRLHLPPLTVQPLVENAVRHGLLSRMKGVTVHIRITRQDDSVLVQVQDDGSGIEPEKVRQLLQPSFKDKGGIGLTNTNRRLTQLYGKGLSIESALGEGTTVSFIIPDLDDTERL
ncbi:ATP-binding protein [Paenibacillus hodogayensis]|uniref:histidine kinase n=1 Tax=Paenibacillus hodogayensis TaxID=279208 RepID=A0ABV5W2X5_9BACL